ncbi:uncharacterized protein OCT59_015864 [Rhizophagus irregularis]|uniref:uncharacterized protein n=1 Tax=Rhizophagus irregularis TaxID=588596 RepID=UPI003319BF03|nr:hypothetical protein OCT59_015864 [Rhizophagus irregularis]
MLTICECLSLESVRKTIIDTYLLERLTISMIRKLTTLATYSDSTERTKKDHGKLQVRISEPSRYVICAVEAKKDESFAQDGSELIG